MANVISCPKCDRQLRVPDDLLGQAVKCPSCSETFTAELPRREPPPPPPSSRPSSRPRDDDDDRPSRRPRDDDDRPSRRPRRDDYDEDDRPSRRRHLAPHRGDTIQLLGILSFFIAGPILGPMAWVMGNNDLKEMDAGRMDPAGRGSTSTGRVCGMVSTILCLVGLGIFVVFFGCACCLPVLTGPHH